MQTDKNLDIYIYIYIYNVTIKRIVYNNCQA